jgi:CBS domain-containing protein
MIAAPRRFRAAAASFAHGRQRIRARDACRMRQGRGIPEPWSRATDGTYENQEITMLAKEVMSKSIKIIPSNTSVQAGAELMREMDIGILPVSEDGRIVGMLSDRDIVVRAVADGSDPRATPVREIMSRDVTSVYEDQDAREVAQQMEQKRVRRVVVVNRKNEAIGLLSVDDLAVHPETRQFADAVIMQFSQHH